MSTRSTTRTDDVLRRLRRDIVTGTWPAGARLTETRLSSTYDVSRVPVREALKQLEVEGFVSARAYAGVTVARMSADDAADLFAVRTTIETITVRRCAARFQQRPMPAEVLAFAERLDALVQSGCSALATGPRLDLPPLNTAFHAGLAEFSGNASIAALLRQVASKVEWLYAMDVDVRGEESWAEHGSIAAAVRAGDPDGAERLMCSHLQHSLSGYVARHAHDGDLSATSAPGP